MTTETTTLKDAPGQGLTQPAEGQEGEVEEGVGQYAGEYGSGFRIQHGEDDA